MIIYRVENSEGWGPFSSEISDKLFGEILRKWAEHTNSLPTPEEDLKEEDKKILYKNFTFFKHGCESLDQLKMWFGDFLPKLEELGFKISTYEVQEEFILRGQYQILFDYRKAEIIQ